MKWVVTGSRDTHEVRGNLPGITFELDVATKWKCVLDTYQTYLRTPNEVISGYTSTWH